MHESLPDEPLGDLDAEQTLRHHAELSSGITHATRVDQAESVLENMGESQTFEETIDDVLDDHPGLLERFGLQARKLVGVALVAVLVSTQVAEGEEPRHEQLEYNEVELIEDYLQLDVEELRKDFIINVDVEIGTRGKYVLHVGATHAPQHDNYEVSPVERVMIVESQTAIDRFLNHAKECGMQYVYMEGIAHDDPNGLNAEVQVREWLQSYAMKLNALPITNEGAERLVQLYNQTVVVQPDYRARDMGSYQTQAKYQEFITFVNTPDGAHVLSEETKRSLEAMKEVRTAHPDTMLYHGAARKQYYNGDIELRASEDQQYLEESLAYIQAYNEQIHVVRTLEQQATSENIDKDTLTHARARLEELRVAVFKSATARDEKIAENICADQSDDVRFIPIVLGAAHDLAEAIRHYNDQTLDVKGDCGLITLQPRVDLQ